MDKSWMPTAAGILQIVTGVAGLIGTGAMTIALAIVTAVRRQGPHGSSEEFGLSIATGLLTALAICTAAVAVVALIGGLFAVRRKSFGWALAGAIAATICMVPLGVAALILTVVAQDEFRDRRPTAPVADG